MSAALFSILARNNPQLAAQIRNNPQFAAQIVGQMNRPGQGKNQAPLFGAATPFAGAGNSPMGPIMSNPPQQGPGAVPMPLGPGSPFFGGKTPLPPMSTRQPGDSSWSFNDWKAHQDWMAQNNMGLTMQVTPQDAMLSNYYRSIGGYKPIDQIDPRHMEGWMNDPANAVPGWGGKPYPSIPLAPPPNVNPGGAMGKWAKPAQPTTPEAPGQVQDGSVGATAEAPWKNTQSGFKKGW